MQLLGKSRSALYDGRGFLASFSYSKYGQIAIPVFTAPVYGSEGRLYARTDRDDFLGANTTAYVFYFGDRPLATLEKGTTNRLLFLTPDHLGTPALATSNTGALAWRGVFRSFGGDDTSAQSAGVFLRFPGQWQDDYWLGLGKFELSYNVHRWYEVGVGRYTTPDPVPPLSVGNLFTYSLSDPGRYFDPDGRAAQLINTAWFPPEAPCLVAAGIGTAWNWIVRGSSPRFAHCYASCLLAKCGGQNLAIQMGADKEFFDLAVCASINSSSEGMLAFVREKHCHSAFQASDLDDNRLGTSCPAKIPCEKRCGDLFFEPDTKGGPFSNVR